METTVISLLLGALLLIIIVICVVLVFFIYLIRENTNKYTYLLSQFLSAQGYDPESTVSEIQEEIYDELGQYKRNKKQNDFDPHQQLREQEEYDE